MLAAAVAFVTPQAAGAHAQSTSELLRLRGDGVHDDTAALQALVGGRAVTFNGNVLCAVAGRIRLPPCTLRLSLPTALGAG